jgi:hypothetical protein
MTFGDDPMETQLKSAEVALAASCLLEGINAAELH